MKLKLTNQDVIMNIGETIRISTHNVLENNKAIGTIIITEIEKEAYKVEITECYSFDTFDSLKVEIVALKEKLKMLEKKEHKMELELDKEELSLSEKLKFILECDELIIKFGKYEVIEITGSVVTLENNHKVDIINMMPSEFKIFETKEIEPDGNLLKLVKRLKKAIRTFETEKSKYIIFYNMSLIQNKKELKSFLKLEDYQDLNYLTFLKLKEKKNYLSKKENFKDVYND